MQDWEPMGYSVMNAKKKNKLLMVFTIANHAKNIIALSVGLGVFSD